MNVAPAHEQGRGRALIRKAEILLLVSILIVLLAAWRFNWCGAQLPWADSSGWSRIPERDRTAAFSDQLQVMHPDWPVLHWLGHAGFRVEWNGTRLLLDPNDADWVTLSRRRMRHPAKPATWGEVDAVLISHGHRDHLVPETLADIPILKQIVMPSGSEDYVRDLRGSATTVTGLRIHETITVGGLDITAVPAAHNGSRHHPWRSTRLAVGYVVRCGQVALYFAGDTAMGNDFAGIRERHHPDLAILPIGAFAPRYPFKIHHLSPEEAVDAALLLGVQAAIPCHFGTFTLTLDYPSSALPRFARAAQSARLPWIMPSFLSPTR